MNLRKDFRKKFPHIDEHSWLGRVLLDKLREVEEAKRKAKIGEVIKGGRIYDRYNINGYEFEIERKN